MSPANGLSAGLPLIRGDQQDRGEKGPDRAQLHGVSDELSQHVPSSVRFQYILCTLFVLIFPTES
jgi:hypothetical protein